MSSPDNLKRQMLKTAVWFFKACTHIHKDTQQSKVCKIHGNPCSTHSESSFSGTQGLVERKTNIALNAEVWPRDAASQNQSSGMHL